MGSKLPNKLNAKTGIGQHIAAGDRRSRARRDRLRRTRSGARPGTRSRARSGTRGRVRRVPGRKRQHGREIKKNKKNSINFADALS